MKTRIKHIKYTLKHKLAILLLWSTKETRVSILRVLIHDLDKVFMYVIFGKEFTSKFHKKYIRHHNNKSDKDFYESYLDYASARYTKDDKPLDALETIEKYKPHLLDKALKFYSEVNYK